MLDRAGTSVDVELPFYLLFVRELQWDREQQTRILMITIMRTQASKKEPDYYECARTEPVPWTNSFKLTRANRITKLAVANQTFCDCPKINTRHWNRAIQGAREYILLPVPPCRNGVSHRPLAWLYGTSIRMVIQASL